LIDKNPGKDVDSVKLILNINEDLSKSHTADSEDKEPELYTLAWFNRQKEEAVQ
jgi:hypothetical protein